MGDRIFEIGPMLDPKEGEITDFKLIHTSLMADSNQRRQIDEVHFYNQKDGGYLEFEFQNLIDDTQHYQMFNIPYITNQGTNFVHVRDLATADIKIYMQARYNEILKTPTRRRNLEFDSSNYSPYSLGLKEAITDLVLP